jgi:hypothetical protein
LSAACKRVREQGFEQADLPLASELAQGAQRLVADAAFGGRHRTQKRRIVVVVEQQAQPGAQVLDLGLVEKALAARDLVGDVGLAQRLLEGAGLVVGAVQDGEIRPVGLARVTRVTLQQATAQQLEVRHGALGLVLLVVAHHQLDGLALAQVATTASS